ncbi:hypothetical protein GFS24_10505 [Chitinophaga sp. SYP-B3965]|uniref:hypothetical protein n=1 Tax=Chitinophaga sp. SYP-B3965 TaxID=2663120 RepID=UPI0012997F12|nr:hypothetical protein [Chitinophaga sp. SYP-B3965]MRG45548.1 hypothetical protein [Chitinophaga sp. SYP-B3965]
MNTALEISLNGQVVCTVGFDKTTQHGVSTIIQADNRPYGQDQAFIDTGGGIRDSTELLKWIEKRPLTAGDEISFKIVVADHLDAPGHSISMNELIPQEYDKVRRFHILEKELKDLGLI